MTYKISENQCGRPHPSDSWVFVVISFVITVCGVSEMEKSVAAGMSPSDVAEWILSAVCARDNEVLIGPLLYRVVIYLRNFLPDFYFMAMQRRAWHESLLHSKQS